MFSKNFMTCSDYYTGTFFSRQLFSKHRSLDTYLTHGTIIRARIVVACLTVNYFFDELDQQVFQYFKLLQQSFTGVQPYRCSKKFTQSLQENAFARVHFHKNAETLLKKDTSTGVWLGTVRTLFMFIKMRQFLQKAVSFNIPLKI